MTSRRLHALVPVVYLAAAALLLGRSVVALGGTIPGAARSDVWNSLWSIWFVSDALSAGQLPWHTTLLDHPTGGVLLVADPLGALLSVPLTLGAGVEAAYAALVLVRVALSGWSAHLLAAEVVGPDHERGPAPWVAGLAMLTAPVLISGIHNGTSEAAAVAPVALAAWAALRTTRRKSLPWALFTALLLGISTLASGYAAVVAYVFVGFVLLFGPWSTKRDVALKAGVLGGGLALSLPLARAISHAATVRGNLVGIKHGAELASVRRTTGPADPLAYLLGFDYRSPDFREISRYGEDFIHCPYVGVVLGGVVLWGLWTHRRRLRPVSWVLVAGGVTFLLSLGPVIVQGGLAWVFLDERVFPMPYLLLERLPGFGSLSLLWRLGLGPVLALSVLAAWSLRGRPPWQVAVVGLLVLVDFRVVAPTAGLPAMTDARVHTSLEALSQSPAGAVLNHPVVGGRAYLHEQTTHGQPLAARLNFPNNGVGRVVWEAARKATSLDDAEARKRIRQTAQDMGVRYVVVHDDPDAGPDMYDDAVRSLERLFPALPADGPRAESGPHATRVTVLRLY